MQISLGVRALMPAGIPTVKGMGMGYDHLYGAVAVRGRCR